MTKEQAKQILQLYRPGTADAVDSTFAEALELCEHDAELKEWLANHCAVYAAFRAKFKKIPVPEGLKEQIIAERPVQHRTPVWQKSVLLAGAIAAVAMLISVLLPGITHRERHDFAAYRNSMDGYAARAYYMNLYTNDLDQIRVFFAQASTAVADYVLPENLKKNATAAGCVNTTWQGKRVSMICFKSGRPLPPGQQSDLWLFISDSTIAEDAPTSPTPTPEHSNGFVTASWTVGNRTYVLAMEGEDKQLLGKFLPENPVL